MTVSIIDDITKQQSFRGTLYDFLSRTIVFVCKDSDLHDMWLKTLFLINIGLHYVVHKTDEIVRSITLQVVEQIAATGIDGVDLRTEILPVEYAFVKKRTQELHEQYRPTVTVHCGMYSEAKAVILEQVARNTGL